MPHRLCLSYGYASLVKPDEILPRTEWLEVRFDLLDDFNPANPAPAQEWIKELRIFFSKIIATYRANSPYRHVTLQERNDFLQAIIPAGITHIDIDYSEFNKLSVDFLVTLERFHVELILSTHIESPHSTMQQHIDALEKMKRAKPWLIKLAVRCDTEQEAHNLMELYDGSERKLIVGMGEEAAFTRLEAVRKGAPFTYGYFRKATAQGQLSAQALLEILSHIS